jgi:low affinity Fe/Cu permease
MAVPSRSGFFDRFAERSAEIAGGALFFTACVLLVVLWAPSYFIFRDLNTWQLVINTATTIVTFLLVALLQNSQRRTEEAVSQKLDALADGLADLMHHIGKEDPELRKDMHDLRAAVGVEHVQHAHEKAHGNGKLSESAVRDFQASAGR